MPHLAAHALFSFCVLLMQSPSTANPGSMGFAAREWLFALLALHGWPSDREGCLCVSLQHIFFYRNVSYPSYSHKNRESGLSLNF